VPRGAQTGEGGQHRTPSALHPANSPVSTAQGAGCAPGQVWTDETRKSVYFIGVWTSNRPSRSKSLYLPIILAITWTYWGLNISHCCLFQLFQKYALFNFKKFLKSLYIAYCWNNLYINNLIKDERCKQQCDICWRSNINNCFLCFVDRTASWCSSG
jgi:hypothetical protein